jgi:hypothetical protein
MYSSNEKVPEQRETKTSHTTAIIKIKKKSYDNYTNNPQNIMNITSNSRQGSVAFQAALESLKYSKTSLMLIQNLGTKQIRRMTTE